MASSILVNNGGVSVANASTQVRPAFTDQNRRGFLILTNAGGVDCYVAFGADAVAGQGVFLKANGGGVGLSDDWQGIVNAIAVDEAGTTLTFAEGVNS